MRLFELKAALLVEAKTREEAEKRMNEAVTGLLRSHADADTGINLVVDEGPLEDVSEEYDYDGGES